LLPIFALLLTLSVCVPSTFQAVVPLEAAIEGYSVVCFYALIVLNCGGPLKVINVRRLPVACTTNTNNIHFFGYCFQILGSSDRVACCDCQTKGPIKCYKRVYWAIWQFIYVRPLVATVGAIIFYRTSQENVFLLIQGLCFLSTVWMVMYMIRAALTSYLISFVE
jgi:hypothetical protein